jgi:two-component SAPR family response regulator
MTTRTSTLQVRTFGALQVTVDGQDVRRWHAGKARELFLLLLVNRGSTVQKERLEELLWPDQDHVSSSAVKVAVHALRTVVHARIRYQDGGYRLDGPGLWSDAEQFVTHCRDGERRLAADDLPGALQAFRDALELYRGDFLPHEQAAWVEEQRQWFRLHALRALEVLRTDALSRDAVADAAELCRRTVEIDPYHETSYRVLMSLHGRRGERGMVRGWYDLCSRRLDELALAPGTSTRSVYARAMGAPVARLAAAA